MQIPWVQSFIARQITPILSEKLGHEIQISGINIQWFDEAKLYTVSVKDQEGLKMIDADVLKVDFSIFSLIKDGDIFLDQVIISNTSVHLAQRDTLNFTQFVRAINRLSKPKKSDPNKKKPRFHIANAILDNVVFTYDKPTADSLEAGRFDHNHFQFRYISGVLDNFKIAKDTVAFSLRNLQGVESKTKLTVKQLKSEFFYCSKMMAFHQLNARFNESTINDDLVFSYDSASYFSSFNSKINIKAHLKACQLSTKDLQLFAPSLKKYQDNYILSGDLSGTVENLSIKDMVAQFGRGSTLKGTTHFVGLPQIDNTLMNLDFNRSEVQKGDLTQYIPNAKEVLDKLGDIKLDANFNGYTSDFVSKGEFRTALGYAKTDINLKTESAFYDGKITMEDFDLGHLINQEKYIQKISMEGEIKGNGFSLNTADFDLDAKFSRFGALGYDYQKIITDGHFQKELFEGEIAIIDPNLKVAVEGEVNFSDSTFNFVAKLDTVSFIPTNILNKSGYAKLLLEANFEGLDPNEITGEISLFNTEILYDNTSLDLEYFNVIADQNKSTRQRILLVYSELFDLQAEGTYRYKQLLKDGERLIKEIGLALGENDSLQQQYYTSETYNSVKEQLPYDLSFQLDSKEITRLIRLFNKEIYISPNAKLQGNMEIGPEQSIVLSAMIDTLYYGQYETYSDTILLTLNKPVDKVYFESEAIISSARQNWGGMKTKKLLLYTINRDSVFYFNNEIKHQNSKDELNIEGNVAIEKDSFRIDLKKSDFKFLEEPWKNTGQGIVTLSRSLDRIHFDNLQFSSYQQQIKADGIISKYASDILTLNVKELNLGIFEPYVGKKITGRGNAFVKLSNVFNDMLLESKINVDSIYLEGFEVGSIQGSSTWKAAKKLLAIQAKLNRRNFDVVKLSGSYKPSEPNPRKKFNLRAILDGLSLQILEPFFAEQISDLGGTGIGILRIKGSPTEPIVKGDVLIYKGKFKVNYLNSTFSFSDQIKFREGFIGMKNLRLTDMHGNKASVDGGIYHVGFKNFVFQLDGKMDNFMVLNTSPEDNDLYYGTAIGTGTFSVFGPPSNIDLSVTARSEKGTKIYIPLDGYSSVEDASFIKFVSPDSTKIIGKGEDDLNLSGIKMDFNIELTPDAYCEIIFDKKAGDIIRGNALGKLKMLIDLQGDFNMFGDVEIVKGAYNFTLLNVVNKEFGVVPGSRITWTGDPYSADLDITATYSQKSSLAPILESLGDSALLNSPEIRRGYPVQVLLNLDGALLAPDITFGIDVQDYPSTVLVSGVPISLGSYVAAFEERMTRDEQELSRQVFSLIVLKRLSAENTFSGISQSAGSSVSELLTNQLSYWISQVDENLEIDFDINGLNADALNTFQLRLSYTFLNGRLRVSREGGFTNSQNETDPSSLIGDWTVEYLLTPDGKLRMKMYRKQNVNAFNTALDNSSTAGVSILRTKSFDSLKDLIPKFLRKKEKKKNDKATRKEDDENGVKSDKKQ